MLTGTHGTRLMLIGRHRSGSDTDGGAVTDMENRSDAAEALQRVLHQEGLTPLFSAMGAQAALLAPQLESQSLCNVLWAFAHVDVYQVPSYTTLLLHNPGRWHGQWVAPGILLIQVPVIGTDFGEGTVEIIPCLRRSLHGH